MLLREHRLVEDEMLDGFDIMFDCRGNKFMEIIFEDRRSRRVKVD